MAEANSIRDSLPSNFSLLWYEIQHVLGRGGFGITYLAKDTNLDIEVAIKEYLPADFASRSEEDSLVRPHTSGQQKVYDWGLNSFIDEAKTLTKFKHPNIVRVLSVFNRFNTAYMVMEYEQGIEFAKLIKQKKPFDEAFLLSIMIPLLDGLSVIHESGFVHRDIKPSNILIRQNGSPVLLDFGSARQTIGEYTRTLTSMMTYGYAPLEQYNQKSDMQGPWTDVYALAATTYHAITGKVPAESQYRASILANDGIDPVEPLSQWVAGQYSPHFLNAIDAALSFKISARPQTALEWREMLLGNAVTDGTDDSDEKTRILPKGNTLRYPADDICQTETAREPSAYSNSILQEKTTTIHSKESSRFFMNAGILTLVTIIVMGGTWLFIQWDQQTPAILSSQESKPDSSPVEFDTDAMVKELTNKSVREATQPVSIKASIPESVITNQVISEPLISTPNTIELDSSEFKNIEPNKTAPVIKTIEIPTIIETPITIAPPVDIKPVKTQPIKKKVVVPKPIPDIEQAAPELLQHFLTAFSTANMRSLLAVAHLSARKRQLVHILFREYQTINVSVGSMKEFKKTNTASVELLIGSLIDNNGDSVEPGGGWKQIKLIIKLDSAGDMRIFWE
ncbi:MAG: serine/threonine protein kinase [Pseudomonadales bacterium]|nr:serine/threonine protein kinase [Pseudomonadales bacterium]